MRSLTLITLLTLSLATLGPVLAEDADTPDDSAARTYCVAFTRSGDAASQAVEKNWLAKLRVEFADQNVLFLTADLSSRGSRHQAKLLLNGLAMDGLWREYSSKPGSVVLTDSEWGRVSTTLTAKSTLAEARAALTKALKGEADGEEDDGDGEDER